MYVLSTCLLAATATVANAQTFGTSSLSSTLSNLRGSTFGSSLGSSLGTSTGTSSFGSSLSSLRGSGFSSSLSSLLGNSGSSFTSSFTPSTTTSSYTPSTTSYTPSYTSSSYTPSYTSSSYTPSYTSSSSFGSYTPQEYVDPRTRAYPEVDSYLKKKDMFDQNVVRKYNLQISNTDFSTMRANPAGETWYPCTVTVDFGEITQQDFQGAGCRYKGSVGSLRMCLDPINGREDGSCRKLSIKVDANKFNSNKQEIGGLKKLNFHGMAVDHSLLAERYVYNMFDQADVKGPRATSAQVYINGNYDGVYGFVEAPDIELTTRLFKDDANKGKGALYKEAWIENRGTQYFEKKRQTDKNEDAFMMEVVGAVYNTPKDKANAVATMERYFDTQSIVDVTAINTLVGATDDWRIRHNFWWYVREDDYGQKKLVMIPWDYDRINDERADSRGPAPGNAWHETINQRDPRCTKRETSAAQKARSEGHPPNQLAFWTAVNAELPPNVDIPVQCDHIAHLMSLALKDRVDQRVLELAPVLSSREVINMYMDQWYNQLAPAVQKDRTGDPPTAWTFQNEVSQMKSWLNRRRDKAVREAQPYGGYSSFGNLGTISFSNGATGFSSPSFSSFGSTLGSSFGGGFTFRG